MKTKKIVLSLCVVVAMVLVLPLNACASNFFQLDQLIRIHILANSNSTDDQDVKLAVRDKIVENLTERLKDVKTREQAYQKLSQLKTEIDQWAISVLRQNGKQYGADVELENEFFPARIYEGIVVDSGYYDALLVTLGEGAGDNWWCVVYPPLCFITRTPGDDLVYRSIILDLWNKFFGKK
jgi:stage II sporulation protein R